MTLDDLIDAYKEPGHHKLADVRQDFTDQQGSITESYFTPHIRAGVLLVSPKRLWSRVRQTTKIKLRYDGNDAALVQPEFEAALWRARTMERESALILRGRPRKVLIEMIFSIIVYLLGVLDACTQAKAGVNEETLNRVGAAIRSANAELDRLQVFKKASARTLSLRWYLLGLPIGAIVGGYLVSAADGLEPRGVATTPIVFCLASGAIGAIVSVMIRISRGQHLVVGSEQGAAITVLAGAFRPLIGAVFGVALYVMVTANIVPLAVPESDTDLLFFFAGLSFLAGFSERWAQDTIVRSAPTLRPTTQDSGAHAPDPGAEAPDLGVQTPNSGVRTPNPRTPGTRRTI